MITMNIFGGFLLTQRMLQMYKKKIKRNDFGKSSIFLKSLNSGIYIMKKFIKTIDTLPGN